MKKQMPRILIGVFISAIVLVFGYYTFPGEPKTQSLRELRIGYNSESITNAPIIIAYEQGYFQRFNLSPKMLPLKSGREIRQAMIAGQVDIGPGGFTNFMGAMEEGAPIRFIAASAASPSYIFVRPNEQVDGFSDLYGKTISVSAGGINELIFRAAMKMENVDTDQMNFVEIDRVYQTAALFDKKAVDAVVVAEQDTEMFFKAGAIVLPNWERRGYIHQAEPRNSIAVNLDYLNQHQAVVEDFLRAYIEAHRFMVSDPQAAAKLLARHIEEGSAGAIEHDPQKIASQWKNNEITNMIWQDPAITMRLARTAKEIGLMEKELTLTDVYDLRFQKALQAAQVEIYEQKNY